MNIHVLCWWRSTRRASYLDYVDSVHRVIEACATQTGESFFVLHNSVDETLQHPYSLGALISTIKHRNSMDGIVISVWNAKNGCKKVIIRLSMRPQGALADVLAITVSGDMERLFAMQELMLLVVEQFSAGYARVLDQDVLSRFAKDMTRASGGELAYIRRSDVVEIEGFTARRHGEGVLYVMDRNLADSGVEARAAAVLRLQPLFDSIA